MPLPVPLEPEVIWIADVLLTATQSQSLGASTPMVPLPPLAGKTSLVGESESMQGGRFKMTTRSPKIVLLPVLSWTSIENISLNEIVGVPLSVPEADRVSPGGSSLGFADQV